MVAAFVSMTQAVGTYFSKGFAGCMACYIGTKEFELWLHAC